MNSKIEFTPQFSQALDLLENSQQHLFITGKAGTGKSTLLEYFCKQSKKNLAVLAPTGVAALNVKGQTIHSFFNFYVDITVDKIITKEVKPRSKKLYKQLDTIIIDEISMVRADLLDCIDAFLRLYGKQPDTPFGGVQIVFVGDLFQLPPVVPNSERELFNSFYASAYFFSAHCMQHIELNAIELDKVYRQKDTTFVNLLNKIRNKSLDNQDLQIINQRYQANFTPNSEQFYIHLATTNKRADTINENNLKNLEGKLQTSHAEVEGDFSKEYYPTQVALNYKIGAQIMLLNNDTKRRWVNGTIAVIEAMKINKEGEPVMWVRLQGCDKLVSVERHTWQVFRFVLKDDKIVAEPQGTFAQFPVRLAWAVTIHKSQGKTFDNVIIDLSQGTFASGQAYVAFSRCTSFEGIVLTSPLKKHHIRLDSSLFRSA